MVKVSFDQKPYRKALMESFGATCVASPSNLTEVGKMLLKDNPENSGSLGIAISEAVEIAAKNSDTKYALGSVLNHVLLHQTIVGIESLKQMEIAGDDPDILVGCTGGGSNFAGLMFPFLGKQLQGGKKRKIVAIEPASCPSLTKGKYAYDFGDTGKLTLLVRMHTLGSSFMPPAVQRYHGMAPLISHIKELGLIDAKAYNQIEVFKAGVEFAKCEGILPAPLANHAVKGAIDEALLCFVEKTILFNLCGHGHFDMQAYINFFSGNLKEMSYSEEELAMASVRITKHKLVINDFRSKR